LDLTIELRRSRIRKSLGTGERVARATRLGHNVWRGGGVTIVVTVIGWLTLLKALLILLVPPSVESRFLLEPLHSDRLFYVRLALTFLLGIYLTYGGIAASPKNRPGACY
jgi:hypothetical protein